MAPEGPSLSINMEQNTYMVFLKPTNIWRRRRSEKIQYPTMMASDSAKTTSPLRKLDEIKYVLFLRYPSMGGHTKGNK